MALQDVTMPAMGADMTEGTVVKWLKSEGDPVSRGDKLAEIETDKTVVEMESYVEGTLRKIILGDGAKVPVGTLLAYVGDPDDALPSDLSDADDAGAVEEAADIVDEQDVAEEAAAESVAESEVAVPTAADDIPADSESDAGEDSGDDETDAAAAEPQAETDAPEEVPMAVADEQPDAAVAVSDSEPVGRVKASPLARRLAREAGYDIAQIAGTGPGGRVTRDDVLAYVPEPEPVQVAAPPVAAPTVEETEDVPVPQVAQPAVLVDGSDIELTTMRQAIARVTTRSMTEAPHYYVTTGIDMTEAMSLRAQYNAELAESGDRVSVNDMIIKALAQALVKYPKWNAFYGDGKLEGHSDINIGVAIALEAGLIVPALLGVQNMSLVEVARAAKDLGGRARGEGGTLTQEELTAGTFSTSNLGMFDIDVFSAIIVPPQAGILAVGAAKPTPVVRDGEIVIRTVMNATISADHRVGDGAEAAVLLNEVKSNLERPLRLIL